MKLNIENLECKVNKQVRIRDINFCGRRNIERENGITLIALVITIIVLLILAGVTIAMLTGENGILTQAQSAKTKTEEAGENEKIELEVLGSYGTDGNLKLETLKSNITKNITEATHDDVEKFPLTVTYTSSGNEYQVGSNGNITNITDVTYISKSTEENFVGYYADIDGDGTVDGIIYADLLVGTTKVDSGLIRTGRNIFNYNY